MAFCQNSFEQFHGSFDFGKLEQANPSEVSTTACKPAGCKPMPPSKHQIKGEKPCDEMRRKGLGEEPSVACNKGQRHCGRRLGDIYVLELFAGTARLTRSMKQKGFMPWRLTSPPRGLKAGSFLEANLSNKGEIQFLLSFIRLKAN